MEEMGWVKLHRSLRSWEWKASPKHVAVFVDLLLEANHKDRRYMGVDIKKGQLTTSHSAIAKRTGVSIKSVRTVLTHLKRTGEVAIEPSSKFSLITITYYSEYQTTGNALGKQVASNGQATGKQRATNKNVKNVKNERNNNQNVFPLEEIYNAYPKKVGKKNGMAKLEKLIKTEKVFREVLDGAKNYSDACKTAGTSKKYIKNFSTWVNGECWEDEISDGLETDTDIINFALKSIGLN